MDFEYQNKLNQHNQARGLVGQLQGAALGQAETCGPPISNLQSHSADNAQRVRIVNQQLAGIRGRLFGECEVAKDNPSQHPEPTPSLQASLARTDEGLLQALQQLSSIIERL